MGLEKAIISGKEHRKPYTGAKQVDSSCRNHGDCPWCKSNRLHSDRKRKFESEQKLATYDLSEDHALPACF